MIKIDDGRDCFFQWDTNRYLTVTEELQELHFSRAKFGKAKAVKVEDGKVKVPDEMLMCSGELYVFGIVEEDGKFTKIEKTFVVKKRPKPENYDGKTNTQIEFEKVYSLIGNLEELKTEQKANLVSAINEIFEMAKNSGAGDSEFDEELLDKRLNDLKVELIGTADDEANKDTIKGAKQLAFDLMNSLENRVVKTTELNTAIDSALLQAKESGVFDGDDGLSAYQIWLSQGNTGSEADFLESLKGDAYNLTEADKDEIVETVKTEVPLVKAAEQPTIVDSVDEMTDTSKAYVLSSDGYFYRYTENENYNLLKLSEVQVPFRLQNDSTEAVSSTSNAVSGWIPVESGKYYTFSALINGVRVANSDTVKTQIMRMNVKYSDSSISALGTSVPYVTEYGKSMFLINESNIVAVQVQFNFVSGSTVLPISNIEDIRAYQPMIVQGGTALESYQNAINLEYVDGDTETVVEWKNTGLAYNQPVDYEDRIIKLETDVEGLKNCNVMHNQLVDKSILNIGDSIAEGGANNGRGYSKIIAEKYNMQLNSVAVGGAILARKTTLNTTNFILNYIENAISSKSHINFDYILLEGGTNDLHYVANGSLEIGNVTDLYDGNYDENTVIGSLEKAIYLIRTTWLTSNIIFVIPHHMSSRDYALAKQLWEESVKACKKWGIPVANIFEEGQYNTFITSMNALYGNESTTSGTGYDRTHPNEEGYKKWYCPLLVAKMKEITFE